MTFAQEDSSEQPKLLDSALFLIGGFLLIGAAIFADRSVWEAIANALDCRLWKTFTWISAAATLVYASYWSYVWFRGAEYPLDDDGVCARRRLSATSFVLAEAWLWVYLSTTEAPRYTGVQLRQFFHYGRCSSISLGIAVGLVLLLLINVFVIARWIIAELDRAANK